MLAALGGTVPGGLTVVPSTTVPVLMNQASDSGVGGHDERGPALDGRAGPAQTSYPLATGVLLER